MSRAVDWDGDGKANAADEWIELLNATGRPADLSGWRLETGRGAGTVYRIPRGTVLRAGAILVLYQRQTRLKLEDAGGPVRLVDRGGKVVDSVRYGALGPDVSYSRDAKGVWHSDWPPSPDRPNVPPDTSVPGREHPPPEWSNCHAYRHAGLDRLGEAYLMGRHGPADTTRAYPQARAFLSIAGQRVHLQVATCRGSRIALLGVAPTELAYSPIDLTGGTIPAASFRGPVTVPVFHPPGVRSAS